MIRPLAPVTYRRALLLLLLMACDPPRKSIQGIALDPPAPQDAQVDAQLDAGEPDLPIGYGVVATDYSSCSISLLDAQGQLRKQSFVHSGSASAGLVTALSGDVALPVRSGERGVLTLIDRFRTDVITRIDLASGQVLGQIKTHAPATEGQRRTYSSNPHDYVYIDADTAWVTRSEPNLAAETNDPDQGLDLLRLDPTRFVRSTERIDFSRWNQMGERINPNTGVIDSVTVYARPAGMVRVGEQQLVVGVTTMSATFDAVGKGLVARVDLQSREVEMLELPGLTSCGSVAPVPGDDAHVAVACSGFERGLPRERAGLVMLRVDEDGLKIEHVWRASEHPSAALTRYGMVALSASEVVAVASGEVGAFFTPGGRPGDMVADVPVGMDMDAGASVNTETDTLYRVDLVSGAQEKIFQASARYVLGGGAFDAHRGLLLVPDASIDDSARPIAGVRRFQRAAGGRFEAVDVIAIHDVLPVRQIRKLY